MHDSEHPRSGTRGRLPTTQWTAILDNIKHGTTQERDLALNALCEIYWRPVYCYVRRKGINKHTAEDLTQGFFYKGLEKDLFGRADRELGRFRNFLLKSLENYLHNEHHKAIADIRNPSEGIVSIHELLEEFGDIYQPLGEETPEDIFVRQWITDLVEYVLELLRQECEVTNKTVHYQLLCLVDIDPILNGAARPRVKDLAREFGLTPKEASNHLLTARRACRRLLLEEISRYASDQEEVREEFRAIRRFLSNR